MQQIVLVTVLMAAITSPISPLYQMFYRNFRTKAFGGSYPRALRLRYVLAGIVVPAALIAFLAAGALSRSPRVLAYGANLMFFLVGWHYVKQGYGILIVDSVQKRLMFRIAPKRFSASTAMPAGWWPGSAQITRCPPAHGIWG